MTDTLRAIIHASEVMTGDGIRRKDGRKITEEDLGRISDGAMVYSVSNAEIPDVIKWIGPTAELPRRYSKVPTKNLRHACALVPGYVDCHTHLVFAGDRAEEFAARCAGATYEEIAEKGGGILATVRATRSASIARLEGLAKRRVIESFSYGVRTIEIKSGYGLSLEAELKQLEVIKRLKKQFPAMTFVSTFLGAHAFPPELTRDKYLDELINRMLPEIAKRKLAEACDVFIDRGYYTPEEGERILLRAKALGLKIKIHADELVNTESARLAARIGALSADHLLKISADGISKIAKSETVAVLLPGTAFYLKGAYAPARKLIEAGASVALATDFNPGTCMILSLPAIMTLAALYLGMSRAEIFAAVTYNGAKALGLSKRKGTLEVGLDADFAVLPFKKFEEVYYRFA